MAEVKSTGILTRLLVGCWTLDRPFGEPEAGQRPEWASPEASLSLPRASQPGRVPYLGLPRWCPTRFPKARTYSCVGIVAVASVFGEPSVPDVVDDAIEVESLLSSDGSLTNQGDAWSSRALLVATGLASLNPSVAWWQQGPCLPDTLCFMFSRR